MKIFKLIICFQFCLTALYGFSELQAPTPEPECVDNVKPINFSKTKFINDLSDEEAYSFIETSDMGFLIVGCSSERTRNGKSVYLIKANSAGKVEWRKYFGEPTDTAEGDGVIEISDGYVITGSLNEKPFIMKVSIQGGMLWFKTYDSDKFYEGCFDSVVKDDKDNLITAGHARAMKDHIFIEKVSGVDGSVIKSADFADVTGQNTGSYNIINAGGGNCIVSGYSYDKGVVMKLDGDLKVAKSNCMNYNKITQACQEEGNSYLRVDKSAVFYDIIDAEKDGFFSIFNTSTLDGYSSTIIHFKTFEVAESYDFRFCDPYNYVSLAPGMASDFVALLNDANRHVMGIITCDYFKKIGKKMFFYNNGLKLSGVKILKTADNCYVILGSLGIMVEQKDGAKFEESRIFLTKIKPDLSKIW